MLHSQHGVEARSDLMGAAPRGRLRTSVRRNERSEWRRGARSANAKYRTTGPPIPPSPPCCNRNMATKRAAI